MSLRRRMILGMLLVVAVSGGVSTLIGGYLLWRHLEQGAENRVRQALNASRKFYDQRLGMIGTALRYTAMGERFSQAVATQDVRYVATRLGAVLGKARLDMLCATDATGRVIHRAHQPRLLGDSLADDRLVRAVLEGEDLVSGTLLAPADALAKEGRGLAERARIRLLPTPKARPSSASNLGAGMMLCAAVPVHRPGGQLVGVLRGGVLLNSNHSLVDQVQNTVFRGERYRGKSLGTATIFQDDVRISTNVRRQDGSRAIGTRVSAEVYDHVLRQGKTWIGPAWVVNAWYISAYDPTYDIDHSPVGMLYVGLLEQKFSDLTLRTLSIFATVTLVGLLGAGIIACRLANRISRPVSTLASASAAIARGEFSHLLPVESDDEIGSLTQSFNTMAQSLKERDECLKEKTRLELTRSERLASIGRLAAGVAHEINNPLTGVLTFAHMLLRDAPEGSPQREDLQTIIDATIRCREIVRGLLDFSRQSEPHKRLSDLNDVLREALALTQNQARIRHVRIVEELYPDLPHLVIDTNQVQQVAVNMIVNAIDAMPDGGDLTARSRVVEDEDSRSVEFEVSDTGCGIPEGNIEHVFDPFFTTKPTGMGTGLGLAIAYGIVAEHGGQIGVSSEVGRGTTITVRLPVTREESHREEHGTGARDRRRPDRPE